MALCEAGFLRRRSFVGIDFFMLCRMYANSRSHTAHTCTDRSPSLTTVTVMSSNAGLVNMCTTHLPEPLADRASRRKIPSSSSLAMYPLERSTPEMPQRASQNSRRFVNGQWQLVWVLTSLRRERLARYKVNLQHTIAQRVDRRDADAHRNEKSPTKEKVLGGKNVTTVYCAARWNSLPAD